MENSTYDLEHLKGISETLRLNVPQSPTESYLTAIDDYRSEVPDILDELTIDKLENDKAGFLENVNSLESLLHGIKELMLVVHCDNLRQAAQAGDLDVVSKCLAKIKPGAQDLVEHVSQTDKNSEHYIHSGNELVERIKSGRMTIEERQREFLSRMPKLSGLTDNPPESAGGAVKEVQDTISADEADSPQSGINSGQPQQAAAKSKYSTEDFAMDESALSGGESDSDASPSDTAGDKSPENISVQIPEVLQTTEREQAIVKDNYSADVSADGVKNTGETSGQQDISTAAQQSQAGFGSKGSKVSAIIPEHHEVTEENVHTYNEHQLFSTLNGLIVKQDINRSAAFCRLLLTHKFGDDVVNMLKSIIDTLEKSDIPGAQTQSKLLLVALESNQLEDKSDTEIKM